MFQPVTEIMETLERKIQPAAKQGQRGKDHQRNSYHCRTLLRVGCSFMPRLAEEDHPDLSSHVKSGEERGDGQQPVFQWKMFTGIEKNFILGPESRKRHNARQCEG